MNNTNIYWPGGDLHIVPGVVGNGLRSLRQKIADTKVGQIAARELGIKPTMVDLPDGESVPVTGTNGLLSWLLGGTNPSAANRRATRMLLRTIRKTPAAKTIKETGLKSAAVAETNPSHHLFRAKVYHGGPVEDPHFAFYTTDPKYAAQYGDVTPYILETVGPAIAKEPIIGSRDVVANDMFIDRNTRGVGNSAAKAIVGRDLVTEDIPYSSRGIEIVSLDPKNINTIENTDRAIRFADVSAQMSSGESDRSRFGLIGRLPRHAKELLSAATKRFNTPGPVTMSDFPAAKFYLDEIYLPMLRENLDYNLSPGELGVITGKHYDKVPIRNTLFSDREGNVGKFIHPSLSNPEGRIEIAPASTGLEKGMTVVHEMSHAYRDALSRYGADNYRRVHGLPDKHFFPITRKFDRYQVPFSAEYPNADFLDELLATNSEYREGLMRVYEFEKKKLPSRGQLLNYIKNDIPDDMLVKGFGAVNGYSNVLYDSMKKLPAGEKKKFADDIRWMLTTVPSVAAPLLLSPEDNSDERGYASGGKIHIKSENRGKFTALKKRTGHSASWFKAHGTPAQKKMAVFALNARKWKHGDGGLIERMQSVYGDDIAAMREAIQLAKSKK